MSSTPRIVRHPDAEALTEGIALRLVDEIARAAAESRTFHLVLTGGGIGIAALEAVRDHAVKAGIDWSHVHMWWGDERFLPDGHPDRNETQARTALIGAIGIPAAQVHPMPASDGPDGDRVSLAADRYSRELAAAAEGRGPVPVFDVCLLGVGPDAHIASLFPGLAQINENGTATAPVHDSPKPPPTRITLTLPSINGSRQVWVLASGGSKAEAVRLGLSGTDPNRAPVAAARGTEETLFWLDEAAAAEL